MEKQKQKNPTYLLELPDNKFRTNLKMASSLEGLSMKDFILKAIQEKMKKTFDNQW